MLVIIKCLEEQRYLLEEAQNKFEIWSNHKNLEYFISSQKLNCRQTKWALYLFRFNFTFKYVPNSSMGKADSLSRHLDWQIGVKKDNKDRVLVKKKQLEIRATQVTEIVIETMDLLEKIKKSNAEDNEIIKAVEEIKQAGVKMLRDEEWQEKDRLILRNRKIYVLKNKKLRAEIIWLYHNILVGKHKEQ